MQSRSSKFVLAAALAITVGGLSALTGLQKEEKKMKPTPTATTGPASCGIDEASSCGTTPWQGKSDAELRKLLTPEQYHIAREAGTERAFTGKYWNTKTRGVYHCAVCDLPLFKSDTKFNSGTGWPSFWAPIAADAVKTIADESHDMIRTEVRCARCGSHLGHVFEDGPKPTGLRYCMNSAVLKLIPEKSGE